MTWNLIVGSQGYGPQGYQGYQGELGIQGSDGSQGDIGTQGNQGSQGNIGTQGYSGSASTQQEVTFSNTVDFKVLGSTTIGTVNASLGRFVVTGAWMHYAFPINLSGGTILPNITITSNGSFSSFPIVNSYSLPTSSINQYNFIQLTLTTAPNTFSIPGGDNIVCIVNNASNATSYTGQIIVIGYYV